MGFTLFCRYRIKVVVIDDTDCTTFVIFYREAKTILQKSCEDMLETIDKVEMLVILFL